MYYKSTVYVSTLDDRSDRKGCVEKNCFSGSSKIWSDKLSPCMIRRTEKRGDGAISNLKEVPTAQRASRDERTEF